MNSVPVVEMFYSLQGEGVFNGVPSIFVRFARCNLSCPGFSVTEDEKLPDYNFIDVKDVTELDPTTMSKGCDSVYAWHPTAKHLWKTYTVEELTEAVHALIPFIDTSSGALTKAGLPVHLVLTGGEPMIHQTFIALWLTHMDSERTLFKNVTIETNGTKAPNGYFGMYIKNIKHTEYLFSLSTKLASSGEPEARRLKPLVLSQFQELQVQYDHIKLSMKFVTDGSVKDMVEIPKHVSHFNGNTPPVYLMPVGALLEQQNAVLPQVVNAAMEYGYGVSMRCHLNFFGNKVGT